MKTRYYSVLLVLMFISFCQATTGYAAWTDLGPKDGISSMVIDPSKPATIYASTIEGELAVYKTLDGGNSWIKIFKHSVDNPQAAGDSLLVMDPTNHEVLYVVGFYSGVHKTTDGGKSWKKIRIGGEVSSLVIDPTGPSTLYACHGMNKLFKSTDGGKQWKTIKTDQLLHGLAIDPVNPSILYAGGSNSMYGVGKSTDGGMRWVRSDAGFPADTEVKSFTIDPATHSTIYANTSKGIYKSMIVIIQKSPT